MDGINGNKNMKLYCDINRVKNMKLKVLILVFLLLACFIIGIATDLFLSFIGSIILTFPFYIAFALSLLINYLFFS